MNWRTSRDVYRTRSRPVRSGGAKAAFALALAIAIAASTALAQSSHKIPTQRAPQAAPYSPHDGQKRYGDLDPIVQFDLMRQANWHKG